MRRRVVGVPPLPYERHEDANSQVNEEAQADADWAPGTGRGGWPFGRLEDGPGKVRRLEARKLLLQVGLL